MRLGEKKSRAAEPAPARNQGPGRAGRARRLTQLASLLIFWWLILGAAGALPAPSLLDDWLRLDPLAAVAIPVAAGIPAVFGGLFAILLTVFAGRLFCGWFCPLGSTLDGVQALLNKVLGKRKTSFPGSPHRDRLLRQGKYLLLAFVLGAAALGLNMAFWAAPLPLITRFYALLVYPFFLLAAALGLDLAQPLFAWLDSPALLYLAVQGRVYADMVFLLLFFGALFWLERRCPRFWCRYLCPAGALLALASFRPLWRRKVSACIGCGRCVRGCPTQAIAPNGIRCAHGECISCQACVPVCPAKGVVFTTKPVKAPAAGKGGASALADAAVLPSRRAVLVGTAAGICLGLMPRIPALALSPPALVRPPGALPEPDFLAACLRCGACLAACPTHALQPVWPGSPGSGLFSPVLTPRSGPCDPDCNACGTVCPTGAIADLPLADKQWAKLGTAVVNQKTCIAFAEGKRCVVCQEVCPYGAVDLVQEAGAAVPVPRVNASRCYGCGYCEHHCPVASRAIVAGPEGAVRLERAAAEHSGAYENAARARELALIPHAERGSPAALPEGALPPGFSE